MFALRNRDAEERQGVIRKDRDSERASERDFSSCTQNVCFVRTTNFDFGCLFNSECFTPRNTPIDTQVVMVRVQALYIVPLLRYVFFCSRRADAVNVVVQLSYAYHQTVRVTIWGNNKIIKYWARKKRSKRNIMRRYGCWQHYDGIWWEPQHGIWNRCCPFP